MIAALQLILIVFVTAALLIIAALTIVKFFHLSPGFDPFDKERGQEKNRSDCETFLNKGREARQAGQHSHAIELFLRAQISDSDCPDIYWELGQTYAELNEQLKATENLRRTFDCYCKERLHPGDRANFLHQLGMLFLKARDPDEAFRVAQKLDPVHSFLAQELRKEIASFRDKTARDSAAQHQERQVQRFGSFRDASAAEGVHSSMDVDTAMEIRKHEFKISQEPDNAESLLFLGNSMLASGQNKKAAEYYDRLIKIGITDPGVLLGISNALCRMGFSRDAVGYLRSGMDQFPLDSRFPSMLALLHHNDGREEDAQQFVEVLIRSRSQNRDAELDQLRQAGLFHEYIHDV
ncbi:MAG: tetratricopeptide repeat protein [Candidatus Wallbacteria bacterium]|nr:tetratricopeptide repeat protein [Candidatus Wallbacteria bacterium]